MINIIMPKKIIKMFLLKIVIIVLVKSSTKYTQQVMIRLSYESNQDIKFLVYKCNGKITTTGLDVVIFCHYRYWKSIYARNVWNSMNDFRIYSQSFLPLTIFINDDGDECTVSIRFEQYLIVAGGCCDVYNIFNVCMMRPKYLFNSISIGYMQMNMFWNNI